MRHFDDHTPPLIPVPASFAWVVELRWLMQRQSSHNALFVAMGGASLSQTRIFLDENCAYYNRVSTDLTEQISRFPGYSRRDFKKNPGHVCIVSARYVMYRMNYI